MWKYKEQGMLIERPGKEKICLALLTFRRSWVERYIARIICLQKTETARQVVERVSAVGPAA